MMHWAEEREKIHNTEWVIKAIVDKHGDDMPDWHKWPERIEEAYLVANKTWDEPVMVPIPFDPGWKAVHPPKIETDDTYLSGPVDFGRKRDKMLAYWEGSSCYDSSSEDDDLDEELGEQELADFEKLLELLDIGDDSDSDSEEDSESKMETVVIQGKDLPFGTNLSDFPKGTVIEFDVDDIETSDTPLGEEKQAVAVGDITNDERKDIYTFFSRSSSKNKPVSMGGIVNWRRKLSNFWPSSLIINKSDMLSSLNKDRLIFNENIVFPSVEHAFHYAKFAFVKKRNSKMDNHRKQYFLKLPMNTGDEDDEDEWFTKTVKPIMGKIKSSSGRPAMRKLKVELDVQTWNSARQNIMEFLIKTRIEQDMEFETILITTGIHTLIHYDTNRFGGESYWGGSIKKDSGEQVGKNTLGNIYMKIRKTLSDETRNVVVKKKVLKKKKITLKIKKQTKN